jgi:hypothetical protein
VEYDDATGLYSINREKIAMAIKELATELLMIEARGDYDGAKKFVEKYRKMPDIMKASLEKLGSVPVDIKPTYAYK